MDEQTEDIESDDAPAKPQQIMLIERKFMSEHSITMEEINAILKEKFKKETKQLEDLLQIEIAYVISYLHRYLSNIKTKREE